MFLGKREDMETKIWKEKQDLQYLRWTHIRSSSGTAGTFLKSQSNIDRIKRYLKISNFDPTRGVVGHECVNEIIVDRLLTILGVEHLHYELIHADIEIDGITYSTYVCASEDFKKRGESKIALDDFYRINALENETHYEFCVRMGWKKEIDRMIAIDYLILNRDRHGANIEVLRNAREHTLRIAPLFDHGLSLLYSCETEEQIQSFDVLEDRRCNNFVGGFSCLENLQMLKGCGDVFPGKLTEDHKAAIFEGLDCILSPAHIDQIWKMIWERYKIYETI